MKSVKNELLLQKWNNMADIVFELKYIQVILQFRPLVSKIRNVGVQINRKVENDNLINE